MSDDALFELLPGLPGLWGMGFRARIIDLLAYPHYGNHHYGHGDQ